LEAFVDWLKSPEPRAQRKSDTGAYLEGRDVAQMPPSPDIDPDRKPDVYLVSGIAPLPTLKLTPKSGRDELLSHFRFQMGGGTDFPSQNLNHDFYGFVAGGNAAIGFSFDDHWSLWLSGNIYSFPEVFSYYGFFQEFQERESLTVLESALSARYTFNGALLRPYLTAGIGSYYPFYSNEFIPMLQAGAGVQCPLSPGLSAFIESRWDVIFEPPIYGYDYGPTPSPSVTAMDFPVNVGVILDLSEEDARDPAFLAAHPPLPRDNFFIKTGGGFALDEEGLPVISTSIALGYDLPSHFSFFISSQAVPGDWGLLGNVQFTLPTAAFFRPYFFLGLGVAFPDAPGGASTGQAGQLGMGLDFQLTQNTSLFTEAKVYGTDYGYNPALTFNFDNLFILATGLKYSLPESFTPATPEITQTAGAEGLAPSSAKTPEDGKPFVEIAGGIDLPARNWQAAYTQGVGGKFSAGYAFKDGLVLQLDVEDFYYSGVNYQGVAGDHELLILPTVRNFLSQGVIEPYLSAGAGLEVEYSWGAVYNQSEVANLDAVVGAGVEVPLDRWNSFFVEGKYNFVFAYGVIGQDIPIMTGARLGF
jgi:hypothetical protein